MSVPDPGDPAVRGFDVVLARDGTDVEPVADLASAAPPPQAVPPVLGAVFARGQREYGGRRRHEEVADALTGWLGGLDVARLPLETRLDSADWRLAGRVRAHGVHLPERLAHRAAPLKRAHPDWLVTAAAHSLRAARRPGPDAAIVSAVFPSRSPSAGAPIGPIRLAKIARAAARPVYALGGVNARTARRLLNVGLAGLAAVDGLTGAVRT